MAVSSSKLARNKDERGNPAVSSSKSARNKDERGILAIHVAKATSPVHGFHLARRGHPRLRRSTLWTLGGKNNPKMKPRIKWGKFFVYLQVG